MKHWTDKHVHECEGGWVAFDESQCEHNTYTTRQEAKEALIKHATFFLDCGSEAYKIPSLLAKVLKKIQELRMVYYINADGIVLLRWNGVWTEYHKVALKDERLMSALI